MTEKEIAKRHVKVLKLHILKPADGMTWPELGKILKEARYRVFRLANLAVSEYYLGFHLWRAKKTEQFSTRTIGELNRELREMLKEGKSAEELDLFSKTGALPDYVAGALSQYKLRAVTSKSKWKEVINGKAALPTFRLDMSIPVRCDKPNQRRLERAANDDVQVALMVCSKPYPKVVIATGEPSLGGGPREVLKRLLENKSQSKDGYCQRCFEIKQDRLSGKWFLFVTYDFPVTQIAVSKERVVGVDLGVSCPIYVAINNGHARLGYKQFSSLMARLRALQIQTITRRREIQRGGKTIVSDDRARSGHGRRRKLLPIEKLEGRIDRAYTTINHQLSAAVIKFAKNNGSGVIQIEDLKGLGQELSGTYLGERWRYAELERFIEYKAKEAGVEVRRVQPQYTSRRCSECGNINMEFTYEFRKAEKEKGNRLKFKCPKCNYEADPDYNAARNIATIDIESIIRLQLDKQDHQDVDL